MLKKLTIANLGCFKNKKYVMDFSPLTIVVGPNNSGKSMSMIGLNLLRYYVQSGSIKWDNEYFNVRDFKNIVNDHDTSRAIGISASFDKKTIDLDIDNSEAKLFVGGKRFSVIRSTSVALKNMPCIWYVRPNRVSIPYSSSVVYRGTLYQPLSPDGSNAITYLLERYTEQNQYWPLMVQWLQKMDQSISNIMLPVRGDQTYFENQVGTVPVNLSCMGSGIQSVLTVMAAAIFSPIGSTVIIEEPEVFLHPRSQEAIVNLFNYLVENHSKQIVFSTHSWSMLLPYIKDLVIGEDRGPDHVHADAGKVRINEFARHNTDVEISSYSLVGKRYDAVRRHFKELWG